jgi:phosphoserine phosphatase
MKIKLVIFDMDNVMFDVGYFENHDRVSASTWGAIWKELDAEDDNNRLKKMWSTGKFKSYVDWQKAALEIFKERGLTRDRFFKVINGLPLMKGAKETVAELKKHGVLTAIISGSFFELAMRAKRETGIDFPFATCSLFFDGDELVDWSVLPFDYEGKAHIFDALIASLRIKPQECAFVCDGVNDIELAKKVGLPIAFGARDELKKCCKVSVDSGDLRDILGHVKVF